VVVSKWKAVASTVTSEDTGMTTDVQVIGSSAGPTAGRTLAGISGDMFQMRIKVLKGGPPFRVVVEGEAAHRSPDTPMLKPYHRNSGDEPDWVQGKIDSARESIYDRLKQYAVEAPGDKRDSRDGARDTAPPAAEPVPPAASTGTDNPANPTEPTPIPSR
jgi:hypothetical protein